MTRIRVKNFMRERTSLSTTGDETLLSVSEYYGVRPRAVALETDDYLSRSESLEGYRRVIRHDLVMNYMLAWKGAYGVSEYEGIVSPAYAVFEIDQRQADVHYIHHRLRSLDMKAIFTSRSKGIIQSRLRLYPDAFLALQIELPDLDTQKVIAALLDGETARIDQLIEKKERQVEVLEEQARVIVLRVLSSGLSGIEWSATSHSMTFRLCNTDWAEMRLSSGLRFMTSGSRGWSNFLRSEGEVFIQSGDIGRHMEVDFGSAQRIQPQTGAEAERTLIKDSDVLICITGGRTGAVGYVQSVQERAYINQHICLLRAQPNIIIPEFLAHVLWSVIGQKQIEMRQYGVKQGLGFNEVAGIRLPVPPRDQQPALLNRIKSDVVRIAIAISKVRQSIIVLREHRSALITAAVTGQVDAVSWRKRGECERSRDAAPERLA